MNPPDVDIIFGSSLTILTDANAPPQDSFLSVPAADGDKKNKGLSKSSSAASLTTVEKDKGLKFNPADGSVIKPQGARDFGRNFDRD